MRSSNAAHDPANTLAAMKAQDMLVKDVSQMPPLRANCLRLTVGTALENAVVLAALKAGL